MKGIVKCIDDRYYSIPKGAFFESTNTYGIKKNNEYKLISIRKDKYGAYKQVYYHIINDNGKKYFYLALRFKFIFTKLKII